MFLKGRADRAGLTAAPRRAGCRVTFARMLASTGLRLTSTFLAVLAPFAVVVAVTFVAFHDIALVEAEIRHLDHAKHAGHIAAAQVREQYIHQAHTLIVRNLSHVDDHYDVVAKATRKAVESLEEHLSDATDRLDAREIVRLAILSDSEFRREVVPRIADGRIEEALGRHDALASIVDQVVAINETLNRRMEERSARAQQQAQAVRKRARATVAWCFGAASAIAILIAAATTRSFMRRVRALRDGADLLARGRLDTRIRVSGYDELSGLADAMNTMGGSLQRNQEMLLKSQRLASLGQVAAGVAHEINNPIGVILGYAKLLQRSSPNAAVDDLRIIENEARQCQRIVSALLSLAKPRQVRLAATDVVALLADSIDRIAPERRQQRVLVLRGAASALVDADESQLRQVFDNILANAIDATADDGRIVVDAVEMGDCLCVTFSDDGAGMTNEAFERAFEPFFTTKGHGTGLGLAICQSIIDAHHGTIHIDRGGPGTVVTLRLPRGSVP